MISFAVVRTINVIRLLAAGVCFGASIALSSSTARTFFILAIFFLQQPEVVVQSTKFAFFAQASSRRA
jgi:hypothetical protein